ncbi:hypothetical protein R3P38DRAFT_3165678 [Favolaschia claudopus]|uniref:Uncharacterized protein n=1 Tax=Favolaschia claudopus TaxID=2862362 RepID=A0AAW0EJZ4_9AGAR
MRTEEPPLPSFTSVLLQQQPAYISAPPPHLIFPWTPVTYYPPFVPAPAPPAPPLATLTQAPAAGRELKIVIVIHRFFATLADKIKAHM